VYNKIWKKITFKVTGRCSAVAVVASSRRNSRNVCRHRRRHRPRPDTVWSVYIKISWFVIRSNYTVLLWRSRHYKRVLGGRVELSGAGNQKRRSTTYFVVSMLQTVYTYRLPCSKDFHQILYYVNHQLILINM